jgi:hypothetical protein
MGRPSGCKLAILKQVILQPNGCWSLPYKVEWNGYFRIRINKVRILAHRFFYEHYKGTIPEGYVIDHLCRNRACVNPEHLEAVTSSENNKRGAKFYGTVYRDNKY